MARRPKDIGTQAETQVVRFLQQHGWPNAERRSLAGSSDRGDIAGCSAIVWEVKGGMAAKSAGPETIAAWLDETERERCNAAADLGILVTARQGYGERRVGMWWATLPISVLLGEPCPQLAEGTVRMTLHDVTRWLRWCGYGEPL